AQASGAVASGTGAEVLVLAGATVSGTTLSGGGFDIVSGTAVSTTVNSGGIEDDRGGGVTLGAQIKSGGLEVVEAGALASGAVASGTGAEVFILAGGTARGTILSGGGFDIVPGTGVSTPVNSGAIEADRGVTNATR